MAEVKRAALACVALLLGMITSIFGMAFRYKAHLDEQHEIRKAEAEARSR